MTFDEARTHRRIYFASGGLTFVSGFLVLFVTALKGLYTAIYQQNGLGSEQIRATIGWIYAHGIVVAWLWPWMSETGIGGTFSIPFSTSAIVGLAFILVSAPLFRNATRLKKWMDEVQAFLAKQEMAASRRPSSHQSIGAVSAGHDSYITQQITNHYNSRPDSPRVAIIVAVIGAIATIAAALLRHP